VVVVSPRAPIAVENGYGWFLDRTAEAADLADGARALDDFIHTVPTHYPADPNRLILMGFSQGAALAYAYAAQARARVCGLVALAGYMPRPVRASLKADTFAGLPVFISHGTQDEVIPITIAQRAHEAAREAGAHVGYHDYPTGHKLNAQGMRDLTRWLAALQEGMTSAGGEG
jgi:phospholipase/carboxylesterase